MKLTPLKYLFFLLLFPVCTFAAEGHNWSQLSEEAQIIVVGSFDRGLGTGCVRGINHSISELFSDGQTQLKQYQKLSEYCQLVSLPDRESVLKVILFIDTAYSYPGSPNIPLVILIDEAMTAYKLGLPEIPSDIVEKWVRSINSE